MAFGELGGDIKANPDVIFEGEAWPNNTTKDSDVFLLGKAQGKVELVGVNSGSAATGALTVSLKMADNETDAAYSATTGTYTTTTLVSAGTSTSWALGADLFRYTPDSVEESYASIRLTTTADKSSEDIDVYLHPIDA